MVGGRAEQVRVEVYPERLTGFGMTLEQLAQTIQVCQPETAGRFMSKPPIPISAVYTGAFLRTAEEIGRLVVGSRGGVPIYVRDVATVTHGPEEAAPDGRLITPVRRRPKTKRQPAAKRR